MSEPCSINCSTSFPDSYRIQPLLPDSEKECREIKEVDASSELKQVKMVMLGMRKSGKTSIVNVVCSKMHPSETYCIEPTKRVTESLLLTNFDINFMVYDTPGQVEVGSYQHNDVLLASAAVIIFVIDVQEEYGVTVQKLCEALNYSHRLNSNLRYEAFIHKVDGLEEQQREEAFKVLKRRTFDELSFSQLPSTIDINFHLTSIYDYSIFEAFSKVVQQTMPQLQSFESLLSVFVEKSCVGTAYLIDMFSKIYLASDSNDIDLSTYELCCDMVDMVLDIRFLYSNTTSQNCEPSALNNQSNTVFLSNQYVMYMKDLGGRLALVSLLRKDQYEKRGAIDYNIECLSRGLRELNMEAKGAQQSLLCRSINHQEL